MPKRRLGLAIVMALGLFPLGVGVYSAAKMDIVVSGTIPDSRVFAGPIDVSVRELTLAPGDKLPWHYHPGHAFNVVKSGTLTVEDGCGRQKTLTQGQGFEEMAGRVHRGANLSNADAVVYDTFVIPHGKLTTVLIPDGQPRCGPPETLEECENGGWRRFTHPRSFTAQGQCVTAVREALQRRFELSAVP